MRLSAAAVAQSVDVLTRFCLCIFDLQRRYRHFHFITGDSNIFQFDQWEFQKEAFNGVESGICTFDIS